MPKPSAPWQVIHSSTESGHRTDPDAFAALHAEWDFIWDCTADAGSSLVGHCYYGPGSQHGVDALKVKDTRDTVAVTGRRFVGFFNPPYSRKQGIDIEPFVAWAYRQAKFKAATIVGVVPAAVQTGWWARYVWNRAHEVRFTPHRWSFLTPEGEAQGNAAVNHCVVVWRPLAGYVGFRTSVNYWTWRD